MHRIRPAGVLLLLAALLLAASASPAVGAYGGRVLVSHRAAAGTRASARLHMASAALKRRLEDEAAPELSWAASLLKGISTGSLDRNKQVCLENGRCSNPGGRYTGHGCKQIYHERC
jgi:hypothetical protein